VVQHWPVGIEELYVDVAWQWKTGELLLLLREEHPCGIEPVADFAMISMESVFDDDFVGMRTISMMTRNDDSIVAVAVEMNAREMNDAMMNSKNDVND
jgi:hypothetical protein